MNLNPLKKDDNTDALVQALEDANSSGTPQQQPAGDPMAAQPLVDDGALLNNLDASQPVIDQVDPAAVTNETAAPADPVQAANSTPDNSTTLSFDDNTLPAGLSTDADAHLTTDTTTGSNDLDGVKKDALEQLRPLIEKLDLEPADKFDKYLMMLRASDDPALIKPAFDAARGITGEKEKAQALLDIINEINYITANQQQS